jgi:hypothetical protein
MWSLKMSNIDQIKLDESIRELTLDELNAVSGGDGSTPNDPNLPTVDESQLAHLTTGTAARDAA